MKKSFLLLAAMCCMVMNSWADCQLIGNEIPSGTGVNARSIINIQYNRQTHILSFEDIYEPTFTAYERSYNVYFYEYSPDYAFYCSPYGGYNPVFYGGDCNSDAFIPYNGYSTGSSDPVAHFWSARSFKNCAGGVISIDLSEEVPQLIALGYNHVMVGISPRYKISASATLVYYSTYGKGHFWLMNTAHFQLNPLANMNALVTEVHTPTGIIDNTASHSPFESAHHVYICEGQDTAKLQTRILPKSAVTSSVTYFWQIRKDDETAWKMIGSANSFTPTTWNNKVNTSGVLFAERDYHFSAGDMERVAYFRLALVCDNDTLYSDEIQIDAKFLEKYGLYILGERVTSLNCADILGDGKVSYDPETKTLTLNDASISASAGMGVDAVAIYDSITIQCVGEMNSISNYSSNQNAAIVEDAGHVTITGNNSLLGIFVNGGSVLDLQNGLTIKDGCSVIAIRTRPMPYATINLYGGVLTIDGANLQAEGSKNAPTIANCGGLVLNNAEITSGHTYDATTHKFLNAAGEEAKDGIIIKSTATGLEGLTVDNAPCTKKFIRNGHLLIMREGKIYNAFGGRMR